MTPAELKHTPSDVIAERLDAAYELIGRRELAFHAAYPRACTTCGGVGLDLDTPAPPAGRPDTCPECIGATPALHPLDTGRQLSRAEREHPSRYVDTAPAVFLATLRQIAREMSAALTARGWSPDEGDSPDYCPAEEEEK